MGWIAAHGKPNSNTCKNTGKATNKTQLTQNLQHLINLFYLIKISGVEEYKFFLNP